MHVQYAPLPPLAYLAYRTPLHQWSEMEMPLPMLASVTQARCVRALSTNVPSPQTFPPRRSSNVLPEPAPLAAAGDATSTAVVVFAATAAAATRVGGRHHRNRAHGPHYVPDHVAGAPHDPRGELQLCASSSNLTSPTVTRNPFLL